MKVIRVHNKLIKIITFSEDSQWQDVDEESAKGQIISKWFFDVFDFLQKSNENKSTWGIIVVKSNSFVCFLEEIEDIKNPFEIIWPLELSCCEKWQKKS